eukprot:SAG31_NODE_940_length_10870_cov_12.600501_3_plen_390_part_00
MEDSLLHVGAGGSSESPQSTLRATDCDLSTVEAMSVAKEGVQAARRKPSLNADPSAKEARREWWRQKAREDVAARMRAAGSIPGAMASPRAHHFAPALAARQQEVDDVQAIEEDGLELPEVDSPSEEARQREIEEVRSEFTEMQAMIKQLRSSAPTTPSEMQPSPSRSVHDIAKDIAAAIEAISPTNSAGGDDYSPTASHAMKKGLSAAERLLDRLEEAASDEAGATLVAAPFTLSKTSESRHQITVGENVPPPSPKRGGRRSARKVGQTDLKSMDRSPPQGRRRKGNASAASPTGGATVSKAQARMSTRGNGRNGVSSDLAGNIGSCQRVSSRCNSGGSHRGSNKVSAARKKENTTEKSSIPRATASRRAARQPGAGTISKTRPTQFY